MQFILPRAMRRSGVIERIARALATLSHDCSWAVEVKEHKPVRSNQQNRYLFGVVYAEILKQGKLEGWTVHEVHDYCLGEHFGWETVVGFGRKKVRPIRRSSRLNKQEFTDFIAFIQQRMAEHGIVVPDPDPDYFLKDDAA
jgi:hypothetical protein